MTLVPRCPREDSRGSLDSQGLAYETIPFDGRSDYDAFTEVGIPAGGIFAGAEVPKTAEQVLLYGGTADVPFDPCYHQLCDTLAHINEQGLQEHKDAAVHAILTFAQTTSSVHGTAKGSSSAMKDWDCCCGASASAGAPLVVRRP